MMKKLLTTAALLAFAISGHAALQGRDLDQNGVTDAFYDTDLNITWLRDANYAKTSGFDLDGKMSWAQANTWANAVTFAGFGGWRLPTTLVPDSSCTSHANSAGANCSGSEMGHLYYTEFGNSYMSSAHVNTPTNMGNFLNTVTTNAYYWSRTSTSQTGDAYAFTFGRGHQGYGAKSLVVDYAMLVHYGDISAVVTAVPEPETYAMLLAGLGLIGAVARRRKNQQV